MDPAAAAQELIAAAETACGLRLTLHDFTGELHDLLPPPYFSHQHPFCQAGRGQGGHEQRCLAHCRQGVDAQGQEGACFVHICWKGGAEAVGTASREGRLRILVFAGPLRSGTAPPSGLEPLHLRHWRALPPPDPERLARLAPLLGAVGHGLLALLDERRRGAGATDRHALIGRHLEEQLHRGVTPAGIGRLLGLSPSRAQHVVAELCGRSLRSELAARRLARAQGLLAAGDAPLAEIARACGFASQHWFNRFFRRATGLPPGRWRRARRAGC